MFTFNYTRPGFVDFNYYLSDDGKTVERQYQIDQCEWSIEQAEVMVRALQSEAVTAGGHQTEKGRRLRADADKAVRIKSQATQLAQSLSLGGPLVSATELEGLDTYPLWASAMLGQQ